MNALAIPREVTAAMLKLGVQKLAGGSRPFRIAGKIVHLVTAEGAKRALDTEAGVEVDPRTERPLGERVQEAAKGLGGLAIGAVKQMIAGAVRDATEPLTKKLGDLETKAAKLEEALAGKADKK